LKATGSSFPARSKRSGATLLTLTSQINGNRLEGKIQARYGYAKDRVKQEVDDWCNKH
jgi:hypothetical protein